MFKYEKWSTFQIQKMLYCLIQRCATFKYKKFSILNAESVLLSNTKYVLFYVLYYKCCSYKYEKSMYVLKQKICYKKHADFKYACYF